MKRSDGVLLGILVSVALVCVGGCSDASDDERRREDGSSGAVTSHGGYYFGGHGGSPASPVYSGSHSSSGAPSAVGIGRGGFGSSAAGHGAGS
jgi:hypothetical protein